MKTTELINKAINYIIEHIEEDILIEDVARYCNYSKYHFSRVFKEETGETIYAFIKRMKMQNSAFRIKVDKNKSITTIAEDYGYSSSNYSSAFKQFHKTSPAKFRKDIFKSIKIHPFYEMDGKPIPIKLKDYKSCDENITIEDIKDFKIIYERYIDTYFNLGNRWLSFLEKYKDYIKKDSFFLEQTYDDPSITDVNYCLYDVGISVDENCTFKNVKTIQGGKYAVYHFKGYPWDIYSAYQSIFNVWIQQSKYEIDKRPSFDIYRLVDNDKKYMEIDFHIPIV